MPWFTYAARLVFRWIFIPWLQAELDSYKDRVNSTRKRKDKNKILPHGVPDDMFEHSQDYGALDFKVSQYLDNICPINMVMLG
jgi:hypothetical protein